MATTHERKQCRQLFDFCLQYILFVYRRNRTHSTSPASFAQGDSRERGCRADKNRTPVPRFEGQASLQTRLAEREGEGEKKKTYIIIFRSSSSAGDSCQMPPQLFLRESFSRTKPILEHVPENFTMAFFPLIEMFIVVLFTFNCIFFSSI
ncbi:hypothetical protein CEXT_185871 [Caerostris extrusa]|uniref:Uncharacterized protein n=1 Tax=Caerostris extrusa TaxID=172846 RepID=A0AAV4MH43_CAEEX|nr:hypothetical protein CEXT_185871 [Caerostris extrusa]